MDRKKTGLLGEQLAKEFLKKKGYLILETNFRCPVGEIDIIARQNDSLVFVEVRTKTSLLFGTPEESITPMKKLRLKRAVYQYQINHHNLPTLWQIDLIAIELDINGRPKRIEHLENAFEEY
jgi:putative endonuclease